MKNIILFYYFKDIIVLYYFKNNTIQIEILKQCFKIISKMIPIRCFSCNKIIANKWEKYVSLLESGMTPVDAFKILNVVRYCCKRMFLGHVEIIDKLLLYSKNKDNEYVEKSTN
jgi:DNA-directed RNA polymerase I, II, and III subunit RPABC5